ncbi:hypothetical protein [Alteribacillus persepolensis]|uniref:hypothetical protein n=1 Tax=Alteribacillus persepolensis TaxID=568899 RepID=UPI000B87F040|nr:hypothetical protein [Alteribacillus persepolensis]
MNRFITVIFLCLFLIAGCSNEGLSFGAIIDNENITIEKISINEMEKNGTLNPDNAVEIDDKEKIQSFTKMLDNIEFEKYTTSDTLQKLQDDSILDPRFQTRNKDVLRCGYETKTIYPRV